MFVKRILSSVESWAQKNYPDLSPDIVKQLLEIDPTYEKGSETPGRYGAWVIDNYIKNVEKYGPSLRVVSFSNNVKNNLSKFNTLYERNLLPKEDSDINNYDSFDLFEYMKHGFGKSLYDKLEADKKGSEYSEEGEEGINSVWVAFSLNRDIGEDLQREVLGVFTSESVARQQTEGIQVRIEEFPINPVLKKG